MGNAGARILLVDHDVRELLSLRSMLSGAGYAVTSASSTAEAWIRLQDATPDMVVLSAELPELDVPALYEWLKGRALPAWVPVVAIASPGEAAGLLASGCDDVVHRPLSAPDLLARVAARVRTLARFDGLMAERRALEQLAITDGLTGLFNHRHFHIRLEEEFRRAARHHQPFALLLIDLDRFKAINDTHGHPVGDMVLRQAAAIVRAQVRDTDLVARYGGEEFAVLVPQTPRSGANEAARRIGRMLEEAEFAIGPAGPLRLTASIGVSYWPAPGMTGPAALVAAADEALYRAKNGGRNQVVLASSRRSLSPQARPGPH